MTSQNRVQSTCIIFFLERSATCADIGEEQSYYLTIGFVGRLAGESNHGLTRQ